MAGGREMNSHFPMLIHSNIGTFKIVLLWDNVKPNYEEMQYLQIQNCLRVSI